MEVVLQDGRRALLLRGKAIHIFFGAHRAMDKLAQGDTHYHICNADSEFQCDN